MRIEGYHSPALAGTTLTLSCPPGRILTGPNTTTCMENGEWEPDPQLERVKCAGNSKIHLVMYSYLQLTYASWNTGA